MKNPKAEEIIETDKVTLDEVQIEGKSKSLTLNFDTPYKSGH
jgi:hypothetical protein